MSATLARSPPDHILTLPRPFPVVLGIGGFLKNTTTLIDRTLVYVTCDAGHTDTPRTVRAGPGDAALSLGQAYAAALAGD